jgi:hypothetical protein
MGYFFNIGRREPRGVIFPVSTDSKFFILWGGKSYSLGKFHAEKTFQRADSFTVPAGRRNA